MQADCGTPPAPCVEQSGEKAGSVRSFGPFADGDDRPLDHSLCDRSLCGGNTPSTNIVYESLQLKKPLSCAKNSLLALQSDTQSRREGMVHEKSKMCSANSPKCDQGLSSALSVVANSKQQKGSPNLKELMNSPSFTSPTLTLQDRRHNILSGPSSCLQLPKRINGFNKTIKHSGFKKYLPSDFVEEGRQESRFGIYSDRNKSEEKGTSTKVSVWPRSHLGQEQDVTPRFTSQINPQSTISEQFGSQARAGVSQDYQAAGGVYTPQPIIAAEITASAQKNTYQFKTEPFQYQNHPSMDLELTSMETLNKAPGIRIQARLTNTHELKIKASRLEKKS